MVITRVPQAPIPFLVRLIEADTMALKGYRYAFLTRFQGMPQTLYAKTLMGLCNIAKDDKGLGSPLTIENLIQYLTDQVKFETESTQC
jgi:hypothetical protein